MRTPSHNGCCLKNSQDFGVWLDSWMTTPIWVAPWFSLLPRSTKKAASFNTPLLFIRTAYFHGFKHGKCGFLILLSLYVILLCSIGSCYVNDLWMNAACSLQPSTPPFSQTHTVWFFFSVYQSLDCDTPSNLNWDPILILLYNPGTGISTIQRLPVQKLQKSLDCHDKKKSACMSLGGVHICPFLKQSMPTFSCSLSTIGPSSLLIHRNYCK